MPAADILRNFESIGDGCEFGFVQDHFGLRPISLLRWAGCSINGLVRALEANFANLFAPENVRPVGGGMIWDRHYEIYYHSQLRFEGEALEPSQDNLDRFARLRRDLRFRLRLFNETLDEGRKIYVFRSGGELSMRDMLRLKSALDLRGPQKLLCVQRATAEIPAGRVERLATGLKLAGHPNLAAPEAQDRVDGPAWLEICAEASLSDWGDAQAGARVARPETGAHSVAVDPDQAARVVTALYRTMLFRAPSAVELASIVAVAGRQLWTPERMIEYVLQSAAFNAGRDAFVAHYSDAGWSRMMARVLDAA